MEFLSLRPMAALTEKKYSVLIGCFRTVWLCHGDRDTVAWIEFKTFLLSDMFEFVRTIGK